MITKNTELTKFKSELSQSNTLLNLGEWSQAKTTSNFVDILAHFLLSLRSIHTRRSYVKDITEYTEFMEKLNIKIIDIKDITEKSVLLWKESLEREHTKYSDSRKLVVQSSVARHLCSLSSLLNFAVKRSLLDKNCLTLITRPKIKRESKSNFLTGEEIKKMLSLAQEQCELSITNNSQKYRYYKLRFVILYTLLSVGMRVEELCELRIGDLEVTDSFAKLHMYAKGGEAFSPIIHPKTASILNAYISEFRMGCEAKEYIFIRSCPGKQTTKITQRAIYDMVQTLAKEAEINKKLSPHSCRASLATLLHNSGIPIGQIQDLLNHKQITTTAIYIKKSQELKEAAAVKIDILDL